MTPLQGGLPQNRTYCGFAWFKFPKVLVRRHSSVCFCTRAAALAATLGSLYRNPPSCAREKTRHAPATGKPRHAHARVRFRKNDGHSPAPNGHPPVRTGQQLCPNRSRWPKKAETGFFPPLRPQRLSCIISIIPRGRCKMAPRQQKRSPSVGASGGSASILPTRKHRKHCLDFSPAKGSGRSHAPAEFLLLKHVEPYAPKDSASFLLPASFPLLKTPLNRMRQGIQLSFRRRQTSHC